MLCVHCPNSGSKSHYLLFPTNGQPTCSSVPMGQTPQVCRCPSALQGAGQQQLAAALGQASSSRLHCGSIVGTVPTRALDTPPRQHAISTRPTVYSYHTTVSPLHDTAHDQPCSAASAGALPIDVISHLQVIMLQECVYITSLYTPCRQSQQRCCRLRVYLTNGQQPLRALVVWQLALLPTVSAAVL